MDRQKKKNKAAREKRRRRERRLRENQRENMEKEWRCGRENGTKKEREKGEA